jgi:hypothetical protein
VDTNSLGAVSRVIFRNAAMGYWRDIPNSGENGRQELAILENRWFGELARSPVIEEVSTAPVTRQVIRERHHSPDGET